MGKATFCNPCKLELNREDVYSHVEEYHVGPRAVGFLYDMVCGTCRFQVSDQNGDSMIEHCFKTGHKAANVTFDWSFFVSKESRRILNIISSGVDLLSGAQGTNPKEASSLGPTSSRGEQSQEVSMDFSKGESEFLCGYEFDSGLNKESCGSENPRCLPVTSGTFTPENPIQFESERLIKDEENEHSNEQDPIYTGDTKPIISITEFNQPIPILDFGLPGVSSSFEAESKRARLSPNHSHGLREIDRSWSRSSIRCHRCKKEIVSKRSTVPNSQLIQHAIIHSDLRFIACLTCGEQHPTMKSFLKHKTRRGCSGKWSSLKTEEKIIELRDLLQACFETPNMEHELANSHFLGTKSTT